MFTGYLSVALVLSALLLYAAARKLSHRSDVVAAYERVGVREARLILLAGLLIAGAAGLLIGVVAAPVGMAAARCLVVYFLAAVVAHRPRDALAGCHRRQVPGRLKPGHLRGGRRPQRTARQGVR